MTSSSSSSNGRVTGTVILVNLYLAMTDPAVYFGDLPHENPLQAYIVHSDKQGLATDVNLWDRPSNTLGLVLVSCEMEHDSQYSFPRSCKDDVIMHFIANVSVTPRFAQEAFTCISKFDGPTMKNFYTGIKVALGNFQGMMKGNRAATRYVGRCIAEVERMITMLVSLSAEEETCDTL